MLQVILSSKMTLSLINLDPVTNENGGDAIKNDSDQESDEIEYEDEEVEEEEEVDEIEDDDGDIENLHGVAKWTEFQRH